MCFNVCHVIFKTLLSKYGLIYCPTTVEATNNFTIMTITKTGACFCIFKDTVHVCVI